MALQNKLKKSKRTPIAPDVSWSDSSISSPELFCHYYIFLYLHLKTAPSPWKKVSGRPWLYFDWLPHVTKFYSFAGTLPMAACGFVFAWPTPSLPKLEEISSPLHLTSDQGAWVVTALPIGACFGTILSALLIDRIGRKLFLYLTSVPFMICWILPSLLVHGSNCSWEDCSVAYLPGLFSRCFRYTSENSSKRKSEDLPPRWWRWYFK